MKVRVLEKTEDLPITVDLAKRQARIRPDMNEHNESLELYIKAGVPEVELELKRSIGQTRYVMHFDYFPCPDYEGDRGLELYRACDVSDLTLEYLNTEDQWVTIAEDDYQLDDADEYRHPTLYEAPGKPWPTDISLKKNSIRITYTSNWTLPENVQLALAEIAAGLWRAGGGLTAQELRLQPMWFGIEGLLAPHKRIDV